MKLLVINPNISEPVTQLIGEEARRSAAPDTALTLKTAPFGVAYIETRFEAMIGAYATAQVAGECAAGHDALIVAAFGDPGAGALREVLPIPVVGLTEAAVARAAELGRRFSIISISARMEPWYRETVGLYGAGGRMAGFRALGSPIRDLAGVQDEHLDRLRALCLAAVRDDGADVLVLAGAPLAGLARRIAGEIPVPLVDGVASAVRLAEALAASGAARDREPLPRKPHAGLPAPIARLLER